MSAVEDVSSKLSEAVVKMGWTPTEQEVQQGWASLPGHVVTDALADIGYRVVSYDTLRSLTVE